MPKLNWSAPKDATWISTTNSMECREPNDVYLLLKSSDFITYDLEHAFDDCIDDISPKGKEVDASQSLTDISYHLVLRKYFVMNPSVEFRCFVKDRVLVAICQRDSNHYAFLFDMMSDLKGVIEKFYDKNLKHTFPDDNFVFDVYVPSPHQNVWLIDINPWAPRTDALLFSWAELLDLEIIRKVERARAADEVSSSAEKKQSDNLKTFQDPAQSDSDSEEISRYPEIRLIRKEDPESYAFSSPKYSAHKIPLDVVNAGNAGVGGIRDFAKQWEKRVAEWEQERQTGKTESFD